MGNGKCNPPTTVGPSVSCLDAESKGIVYRVGMGRRTNHVGRKPIWNLWIEPHSPQETDIISHLRYCRALRPEHTQYTTARKVGRYLKYRCSHCLLRIPTPTQESFATAAPRTQEREKDVTRRDVITAMAIFPTLSAGPRKSIRPPKVVADQSKGGAACPGRAKDRAGRIPVAGAVRSELTPVLTLAILHVYTTTRRTTTVHDHLALYHCAFSCVDFVFPSKLCQHYIGIRTGYNVGYAMSFGPGFRAR
ncbi:hypothetical protein B0T19DRAFT_189301 [Cercophora scortea]|uniref:Uncharacterized protein n=1 Tax=Cercophora scortea TaxID=314031 RepID=A0AAE0IND1_9PEZI|nr:hypothetical protein B0T19DRAFT_189301 [Cercophora scortea]